MALWSIGCKARTCKHKLFVTFEGINFFNDSSFEDMNNYISCVYNEIQ